MILTYAGCSRITAQKIADASDGKIRLNRGPTGDINWGRAMANTKLNPNISTTTNKRKMCELFRDNGVPMPKLYDSPPYCPDDYPVVGRSERHSKSRGFWKCADEYTAFKAVEGTKRKAAATHFMEYIEADREFRVHIFNGKSIRISQKDFTRGRVSNVRAVRGGIKLDLEWLARKPQTPVRHIRKAAKQAVAALGLDFGAVDILEKDGKAYVLEVNAAPGLGGSLPRIYAEAFITWKEELCQER